MAKKSAIVVVAKSDLQKKTVIPSEALIAAVAEANGRATAFVYFASDIVALALRAERRLEDSGLPKGDRVGFEVTFDHAGPNSSAYKYSAVGRRVSLRRTTKGWVLTAIDEITVYPKQSERAKYRATAEQIEEMKRRAVADVQPIAA